MNRLSRLATVIIYATLVAGGVIFSFPFLWLASTSVKTDRELYTGQLGIFPAAPSASLVSPFVDDGYYSGHSIGARTNRLLSGLDAIVRKRGFLPPKGINVDDATRQVARGLIARLNNLIPARQWNGSTEGALTAAGPVVTRELIDEVFESIYRRLELGPLRVRSIDLATAQPDSDTPVSAQWTIGDADTARITDSGSFARGRAILHYDLSHAEHVTLNAKFDLPFDADQLRRVQLDLRPDDSWHELRFILECNGVRYAAERPTPLANFTWTTLTWQWPSDDDDSTRIKTWTVLHAVDRGPQFESAKRRISVTLEIDRSSQPSAWAHKLAYNYQRVGNYIPLWRYLRVSLFLVIANIILTVFASSLAAYAFARLQWPGRDFCFYLMLATMMIPSQVTMIPQFLIWKNLGAFDTLSPLWLGAGFGNAFFIFLLRQFFRSIPRDMEDAPRIDGCGFLRTYWHAMLPLVKPCLAAIAIFTFIGTWNDFLGPLIYIADQRLYPMAFGLYALSVQVQSNPTLVMAGGLMMTIPVIAIFFFAQRYFILGVTLTGSKE
jgi:multiple sugar transport system permease protein